MALLVDFIKYFSKKKYQYFKNTYGKMEEKVIF